MNISADLKKALLVCIGAVAMTGEKAIEMVDTLAAKGKLAMEQGKTLSQEPQCAVKNNLRKPGNACAAGESMETQEEFGLSQILDRIDSLTPEEIVALKNKLTDWKCE